MTTLAAPHVRRTVATSAPTLDQLETLIEAMTIDQLRRLATAAIDARFVASEWARYVGLDAVVETDTFHTFEGLGAMTVGFILAPASGMPTLLTALVVATVVDGTPTILHVDRAPTFQRNRAPQPQTTLNERIGPNAAASLDDADALATLLRTIGLTEIMGHCSDRLDYEFDWRIVASVTLDPKVDTFVSMDGDVSMEADATFVMKDDGTTDVRRILVTIDDHADDHASPFVDLH